MNRLSIVIVLAAALLSAPALRAQEKPDDALLRQAKLLIFDKDWAGAAEVLDRLLEDQPAGPLAGQARFYRGKALAELKGRERDAIKSYRAFLDGAGASDSLRAEAEGGIVDLSSRLYAAGDRSAVREIEARLKHPDRTVRYYAAYKLSLVSDKAVAAESVPVLREMISSEKDPELRDRARIALLRVSPRDLDEVERHPDRVSGEARRAPVPGGPRMFRIEILEKGKRAPTLRLNLPWALASLVIDSLPDEEKASLRKKGYDMNRILAELDKSGGTILEIAGEDSIIKIWIE